MKPKPNLSIWLSPFGLFDSLFKFEQIQLYSDWGEFTLTSRLVIENYFILNLKSNYWMSLPTLGIIYNIQSRWILKFHSKIKFNILKRVMTDNFRKSKVKILPRCDPWHQIFAWSFPGFALGPVFAYQECSNWTCCKNIE